MVYTVILLCICQQLPNCNYFILFDVRCVLTVHNILYKFDNTQRDNLSQIYNLRTDKFPSLSLCVLCGSENKQRLVPLTA